MTPIWLFIGFAAILLSIIGVFLCTAGLVALWRVKRRLDAVGKAVFAGADDAFAFVDGNLERVKEVLQSSRRRLSGIASLAERLRDAEADTRKASEPLLQSLDAVFQELQAAQSWLESSHAVAKGVSCVAEAVVSSQYAAAHEEWAGIAVARRVQEMSESVADILARLEVVRQELVELRDTGRFAREVAIRVVA